MPFECKLDDDKSDKQTKNRKHAVIREQFSKLQLSAPVKSGDQEVRYSMSTLP